MSISKTGEGMKRTIRYETPVTIEKKLDDDCKYFKKLINVVEEGSRKRKELNSTEARS
jgi:hypothetical protein